MESNRKVNAKTSDTKLLEVHRVRKELNLNFRPEKQHAMPQKGMTEKPHIGQRRVGLRRKYVSDHVDQPFDVTRRFPEISKTATGITYNPTTYKCHA